MSRIERLREYKKMSGPCGASRDKADLDYWANRASANSERPPRATNKPKSDMPGKADPNFVGSSDYMPGVRRTTT